MLHRTICRLPGFRFQSFQDYLHYYRKVAEYIPNRDDAFGLSGFCYYYLGQEYQAKKAYKKALEINKYFFWHYYNLAVIHFKNGQYEEVAALLKKALDIKPKMAVMVMLTSKIYNDIFGSVESLGDKPTESLGAGYADARRMLVLSYYHLKDFENMLQVAEYSFRTKADPTMDFYFYAGLAAYEMKQYGRAIQIFQEMAEKNPLSCEAFHYIGLSARALGREDVARGALRQAERLRKKHTSYERINIEDKIKVQFF